MPDVLPNPCVDINNARHLPSGTVIDRPTGELALLWALYARLLEREARRRPQSKRKQKRRLSPRK